MKENLPSIEAPGQMSEGGWKMRRSWWLMLMLAMVIAAYATAVVVSGGRMFPPGLADSFRARPWGIYPHALFGSVALALGAFQLRRGILARHRGWHRLMGKIYVVAALTTGAAGFYMAFFSFGGLITHLGFGLLAILTVATTSLAYAAIRRREIGVHREWMIRSYALIFAAVTLRIELPVLTAAFGDFTPAYRIIAWLCWVPNLLAAELLIRRRRGPALDREVLSLARSEAR
jgi:uncharacterized membrane protein